MTGHQKKELYYGQSSHNTGKKNSFQVTAQIKAEVAPIDELPERVCLHDEMHHEVEIEEEIYSGMPQPRAFTLQYENELLIEYNGAQKGGLYTRNQHREWHCHDCVKAFKVNMKDKVERHHRGQAHVENMALRHGRAVLRGDPDASIGQMLAEASIASDVNFHKLCSSAFRKCLQKLFGQRYPSETVFREKHVDIAYIKALNGVRAAIGDSYYSVEVDGTTDVNQRAVVNVLIRVLDGTQQKPHLANCVYLDEPENSRNIAEVIENTLTIYELDPLKFRVLVSDSVSFMLKCGRDLKAGNYPNIIHICCLAHGLHRLCEKIKYMFGRADSLIAACKKIFRKAPKRLAVFTNHYPQLDRPPIPVATRWGSWLMAASYFYKNYEAVKDVVTRLSEMDGGQLSETEESENKKKVNKAIRDSVALFDKPETILELKFLHEHLSWINFSIKHLEHGGKHSLSLLQQLDLWDDARNRLVALSEEDDTFGVRQELIEKFDAVSARNEGLGLMKKVNELLLTAHGQAARNPIRMTLQEARNLRYVSLVNVECERFFSFYKSFLNDNRRSFMEISLHKYMERIH